MQFEEAIEIVLAKEGGYVFNPKDSGGETKFGISKRSYPKLDIKNLTREQAIEIYRADFWNGVRAYRLPANIRLHVFDFAVNAGVGKAIKKLQIAASVKADGIIGNLTLEASKRVTPWKYAEERVKHYVALVRVRPNDLEFLNGWMRRNLEITKLCLEYEAV